MKLTNQLKKWVTNNIKNKADTIFYIILCGVFIGGITVVLIRLFIDFRNLNIEMSKDTTETIQLYSIDPEQEIYGKFMSNVLIAAMMKLLLLRSNYQGKNR